jgi:hypothetical protein
VEVRRAIGEGRSDSHATHAHGEGFRSVTGPKEAYAGRQSHAVGCLTPSQMSGTVALLRRHRGCSRVPCSQLHCLICGGQVADVVQLRIASRTHDMGALRK